MGCESVPRFLAYPEGQRIFVKTGYDMYGRRAIGKDLAFSVIMPPDEWIYYAKSEEAIMGYLSLYGVKSKKKIMLEWLWINKESTELSRTLMKDPYYFPWYTGIKGDGSRIIYMPTESQLQYGDWHRGGYSQTQFRQVVYKGRNNFYCVRTVTRRGGYTPPVNDYSFEYLTKIRPGTYSVFDTCPFRRNDGKDAYFKVSSSFNVSEEDVADNPQIIEYNLKILDEWLKPMWDSVEIMPGAYQFDTPIK